MSYDVAVIGGGVSGLATAYALKQCGYRVALLERQVHAGGNAISERIGGFLMEHGPSSLNAAIPEAQALSQALGLDSEHCELSPCVRYRYLMRDHRLHRIKAHPLGFTTSNYLPASARLRMLVEFMVPAKRGGQEESVGEFWSRRFGRQFAELVIDPLVGGLFAGMADELSMPAVFPALLKMEQRFGSVSCAVLAARRSGGRMPGRQLYSWQGGMQTLPNALGMALGETVKLGVAVRRIRPSASGFRIEYGGGAVEARSVVLATQPHVAAALLEGLDAAGAEAAASIDAPALATVFLGYRRDQVAHALDGLGYLTPCAEKSALSGALFASSMFAGRAPSGHVAFSAYLGGARAPELAQAPSEDLIAMAKAEFAGLLGVKGEPVVARSRQWPRGLPQYRIGHSEKIETLRAAQDNRPGLFLTGNYLSGLSVVSCIASADDTARRVHGFLAKHAIDTTDTGYNLLATGQRI